MIDASPRRGPWPVRCTDCKKELARKRSRETHRAARKAAAKQGICINCRTEPVMQKPCPPKKNENTGKTTTPKIKKYKMCQACYDAARARYVALHGERPPKPPKPQLTTEEKKQKWSIYHRERRQAILAKNPTICTHCLKEERQPYCTICEDRVRSRFAGPEQLLQLERRAKEPHAIELLANNPGLCPICLKRNRKTYCLPCQERVKAFNNRRNQERRKRGLCLLCEKPAPNYQYCDDCREKVKGYIRERRIEKKRPKTVLMEDVTANNNQT
jgi:hypothetical protein